MSGTKPVSCIWVAFEQAFASMWHNSRGLPASVPVSAWSRGATGVSNAPGLEKLEGNAARSVFSGALKNKTVEELEEVFAVGTSRFRRTTDRLPNDPCSGIQSRL